MKQPTKQPHLKKEDVRSQLRSLVNDIRVLSLKHPDEEVNEFKLGFINITLKKCNEILGDKRPYESFELFDTTKLPTNSDVLMILNTYLEVL